MYSVIFSSKVYHINLKNASNESSSCKKICKLALLTFYANSLLILGIKIRYSLRLINMQNLDTFLLRGMEMFISSTCLRNKTLSNNCLH